ncbi:MFS transporter [Leifsonia sp. NPDC077715]|uniref:MFS transporter n=1 Tax=Leifsonia sp. NPDC077715 TaxID=3155539 RepID=UPI00341330F2
MTDTDPTARRNRAAFWTAAAVPALALWASGAPTPVYPLYGTQWHLTTEATTTIFAVYPLALIVVLAVFGDLSDTIGRKRSMIAGIGAIALGSLLFAVAPDLTVVLIGRVLMGIGVGLSLSPATAAMVDHAGPGASSRASSIATAATALGLTLATLVGGALVEYAPEPLHLSYAVLLVVALVVGAAVLRLPGDRPAGASRWRPRGLRVPRSLLGVVLAAAACVAAAYSLGALELSLGADIGENLIGTSNAFVVGAIVSVTSIIIGVVALAARRVPASIAGSVGGLVSLLSTGVLVAAGAVHSLPLFLLFAVLSGIGYSLLFSAGLAIVGRYAPQHHRASTLSAVYLAGYLVQGVMALWLGAQATSGGLQEAVDLALPAVGGFGLLAMVLVLVLATPRRSRGAQPPLNTSSP